MTAIYKREMKSYFTSLITYFFFAVFFAVQGLLFSYLYQNGSTTIFAIPFAYPLYLTIFLIPLLTMRTISEDKRQKVDQVLLTAPVSVTAVIMGKFLACLTVYAIAISPLLIYQVVAAYFATVNWLLFLYAILGTMLLAATLIACGIFISSLTESTALAAVLTVGANIVLMFIDSIVSMSGVEWLSKITNVIGLMDRYAAFADGVFSIPDVIYYLSFIVVFLFLTVRSVEKRRWA
ncbi:MAG: ABC transporter [Ruminococcaceae bacterium]|nr:ABC transporter [Oscillospiraceae bacterium]